MWRKIMFEPRSAFSGFSVDDPGKAKTFYADTLGLKVEPDGSGLRLHLPGGPQVFVYSKPDHQPAAFTILNFEVDDIDAAVNALKNRGVQFERYDDIPADEHGILRGLAMNMGPDIAWFKDPAGNILSVLQSS
jgi:catechol 2,3-dioxygenase-like lactoylglutathione lyase family enzyme